MTTIEQPTVIILFGATGDLSRRYLFPSLFQLFLHGHLPTKFELIASGRSAHSNQEFRQLIMENLQTKQLSDYTDLQLREFLEMIGYLQGDLSDSQTYQALADLVDDFDNKNEACSHKVFYFSISPSLYEQVIDGVTQAQSLFRVCSDAEQASIVVEKPFGRDLKSFKELNSKILSVFSEEQIYRIDHYLGKETVQNILHFKNANPIIANDLNSDRIESVEIINYENIGVGSRAAFYDKYGQLRDMLQSHVLQLLAVTLVDSSDGLDYEEIKKRKIDILKSMEIQNIDRDVVRAVYTANPGLELPGYKQEPGISEDSRTETFVSIKGIINKGEWQGLPFKIATGKRMPERLTEIVMTYKASNNMKNRIIFTIQPNESIHIEFFVKKPRQEELQKSFMSFNYDNNFSGLLPNAYENLLQDVLEGKKGFFLSSEELEAAWSFVEPVLAAWESDGFPVYEYRAGELPSFA